MNGRTAVLRSAGAMGAFIGYGCLLAFLSLVGWQVYGWFRDGEWTHVGLSDGLHAELVRCCVKQADNGQLTNFVHWLGAPVSWLGMHKVFEVIPASLALFALSIAGNCIFVYCKDRLDQR
ncbi:MAG: hypothetical protein M3N50_00485 [Pseudomonadota bacterium]|nr:hypothetical protein [Pseudomonadota bacterium]